MGDYGDHSQSDGWDDNRKSGYDGPYNDMTKRNYGKGHRQDPPFRGRGIGSEMLNRAHDHDDRGWYRRPDSGGSRKPIGPKDPDAGSGSNAKEMPKTEEFERTVAPERRFIEAPSLDLARKV